MQSWKLRFKGQTYNGIHAPSRPRTSPFKTVSTGWPAQFKCMHTACCCQLNSTVAVTVTVTVTLTITMTITITITIPHAKDVEEEVEEDVEEEVSIVSTFVRCLVACWSRMIIKIKPCLVPNV